MDGPALSAILEKPGLMELMGRAVNATDLSTTEGREGNVERLAAMGLAQVNPEAREHKATEAQPEIDPRAALGSLLIRIKAGRPGRSGHGDSSGTVPLKEAMQAVNMLTHWIRQQNYFKKWKLVSGRGMLQTFVQQVVAEWLNDRCAKCDGVEWTGVKREQVKSRRRRCRECKGVGFVTRTGASKARPGETYKLRTACPTCCTLRTQLHDIIPAINPKVCGDCKGTGLRLANDGERARLLRISEKTYDQYWVRRFLWLRERLDRVEWTEKNLLQVQLGRGINRSV